MHMRVRLLHLVLLLSVFLLAFLAASRLSQLPSPGDAGTQGVALSNPEAGVEVAVVLIVSSRCAWSNDPDLVPAWTRIVNGITATLPQTADRISLIGVVEAATPNEGLAFLAGFGEFYEVIVGHALNNGALRYMINDLRGPIAYPQIVIVRRAFALREDGSIYRQSEVAQQRLVGLHAITAAARQADDRSLTQ